MNEKEKRNVDALLAAPLLRLPGVGEKRAEQLARLGLHTVSDLLFHFPRAYENRGDVVSLAETQEPARAGARQAGRAPQALPTEVLAALRNERRTVGT